MHKILGYNNITAPCSSGPTSSGRWACAPTPTPLPSFLAPPRGAWREAAGLGASKPLVGQHITPLAGREPGQWHASDPDAFHADHAETDAFAHLGNLPGVGAFDGEAQPGDRAGLVVQADLGWQHGAPVDNRRRIEPLHDRRVDHPLDFDNDLVFNQGRFFEQFAPDGIVLRENQQAAGAGFERGYAQLPVQVPFEQPDARSVVGRAIAGEDQLHCRFAFSREAVARGLVQQQRDRRDRVQPRVGVQLNPLVQDLELRGFDYLTVHAHPAALDILLRFAA